MKKVLISFIGLITLFIPLNKVLAGASISTSASSIYVGNSVTVSVTVSEAAAWEVHIGVSGAASSSNCSGLDFADSTSDTKNTTKTYTATCTPTKTGTINFVINSNSNITNQDGVTSYLSGSKTVTVTNKPVVQQPAPKPSTNNNNPPATVTPKSSVNYLKSLMIEGKEISPKFNKETLEYTVELESGITTIDIKATAEHNKAKVSGTGVKNVTEGVNNFDIVVTAENGSKRTYKLKAIVKEKDPIIVDIDNNQYTVIRKKEQLPQASAFYSESTIEISGQQIPIYFGEVTGYTLVGLKNSEGLINLYVYDEDNNKYTLYQEFNFSKVVLYPIKPEKEIIPKGFVEYSITINGIEISCYKRSEKDDLILLYGVNIENNNEGFYTYDSFENTLQRYNDKIFNAVNEEIFILRSIVVGLFSVLVIVVVASAIQGTENKFRKRTTEPKNKAKEKTKVEKEQGENKKAAKLLEKELKRKEKLSKQKKKRKKDLLENTNIIDITDINIKK